MHFYRVSILALLLVLTPCRLLAQMVITKELVMGKVEYAQRKDFTMLPKEYAAKRIYLQEEVAAAFVAMCKAASADGVKLWAVSGARNYAHQRSIWERKWQGAGASLTDLERVRVLLEYSAMPMASRHHWGTEIDINSVEPAYFASPQGKKVYQWLGENAHKYGFCQVYDASSQRKGYKEEKWHWSYLPLAQRCLDFYLQHVKYNDFKGFSGSQYAEQIKIIADFVKGIGTCVNNKPNKQ